MSTGHDYRIYTTKQETDKAIHLLKGILLGINLDGEVNEQEIYELKCWADEHKFLMERNPFKEFITTILSVVNSSSPKKELIEDLYWLTQKYEGDSYYFNAVTSDLQILQGLCHGILADGTIKDSEVIELNSWLTSHQHLSSYYPYDEINSLLLSVLKDGVIDDDERKVLKAYFNQFIKINSAAISGQILDDIVDVKISGLCTSDPKVVFSGQYFCVTGILKRGTREQLHSEIVRLGGIIVESVTKKTNYLIVGDNGNPAWAFACYGRKVEKAVMLRKEGNNITIIHEFDFGDIIDDMN